MLQANEIRVQNPVLSDIQRRALARAELQKEEAKQAKAAKAAAVNTRQSFI